MWASAQSRDGLVEQIDEGDDPGDARLRLDELLDPPHLAQALAMRAVRFDEDERVDRSLLERREVLRAECALERGRLGEPGIVEAGRIPEMHVRVHHARARHR